jgi:hypothetical protein
MKLMVLKEEYKTSADTSIIQTTEEKEKEDLKFEKRHQNSMYQILIDVSNFKI